MITQNPKSRQATPPRRRDVMMFVAGLPVISLVAASAVSAQDKAGGACFNEAELSSSQRSFRRSLRFQAKSADPAKVCTGCVFFEPAEAAAACGNCKLLNSTVSAEASCGSWAKKPG